MDKLLFSERIRLEMLFGAWLIAESEKIDAAIASDPMNVVAFLDRYGLINVARAKEFILAVGMPADVARMDEFAAGADPEAHRVYRGDRAV